MIETKKFTDIRALNKVTSGISQLFNTAQIIRFQFESHFGFFKFEDLKALMHDPDPARWIKLKWIEINGVETRGLNIDNLVNSGLVQVPKDYSRLLSEINEFKARIVNGFLEEYIPGIDCFFRGEEVFNPLLEDDHPLYARIEDRFSITISTEEEEEFIRDLEVMGKIFEKMVNQWRFSLQYIPMGLFMIETLPGGHKSVYPIGEALKRFRLCHPKPGK